MSFRELLNYNKPLTDEERAKVQAFKAKDPVAYDELMKACAEVSALMNRTMEQAIERWRTKNPESTLDDREVLLAIDDENDAWHAEHPEYKDLSFDEQIEYLENLRKT